MSLGFVAVCVVFAPVIFGGRVLAVGDGLIEAVPGFFASAERWQPAMFAGFPIASDPSKAFWYPLRILQILPAGFNIYVLSAYTIAGCATYGYVLNVTKSIPAGIAAAFAFAAGGFFISQLGHPMIVEPASWFGVSIWALDLYMRTCRGKWLVIVFGSEFLCLVSGQPQIAAFATPMLLGYLYFCASRARRPVIVTYAEGTLTILLGIASAALAWIPTLAQSTQSLRSGLDFGSYVLYSAIPSDLAPLFVFPFVGGGGAATFYHQTLLAATNFGETANYVPLSCVMLVPFAFVGIERRIAIYWSVVACVALALSVGNALPLAMLTFRLPGFDLFRIPGRHAFELTFALAVVAGMGVAGLERATRAWFAGTVGLGLGLSLVAAAALEIKKVRADFLTVSSVSVFLVAAVVQAILLAIAFYSTFSTGIRVRVACLCVLIGSCLFAETAYWRDSPKTSVLNAPPYVEVLRRLPIAPGQRVYTEGAGFGGALTPNLPNIWDVPEFGGYTPLQFASSSIFLQTGSDGRLLNVDSPIVDAAAVRYFASPSNRLAVLHRDAPFANDDLGIFLSIGRPVAPRRLTFGLPIPQKANELALVTALGASVEVRQGAVVALVLLRDKAGNIQQIPLRAGRETAELFYDRPDVMKAVRHHRATIYERDDDLSWYVCNLPLRLARPIVSVTITMVNSQAALNIRHMSLIDEKNGRAFPFALNARFYGDPDHFRHVGDVAGVSLFENSRSFDGAWVARSRHETMLGTTDEALATARENLMRVDLRREAVTTSEVRAGSAEGAATILSDSAEYRIVAASCRRACVLVSSSTYTPDWRVAVDERPARLLRVDRILQGVALPPGRHVASFSYEPIAGRLGFLVSGLSVAAMGALLVSRRVFRRRLSP